MNPTSATCCHKTILRKVLKIPYNWISIAGRAKLSTYVVLKRNRVSYIRYFKTQWHRVTVARNSLLILGYDALPKGGSMGGIVIKSYKFVVRNSMINQKQQQTCQNKVVIIVLLWQQIKWVFEVEQEVLFFCTFSSTKQVILFNLFFCAPPKKLRRSSYTPLLSHNKALM